MPTRVILTKPYKGNSNVGAAVLLPDHVAKCKLADGSAKPWPDKADFRAKQEAEAERSKERAAAKVAKRAKAKAKDEPKPDKAKDEPKPPKVEMND